MTTQQAMNVAESFDSGHSKQVMADALIVLRDALRSAEGQVAAMREAAAKVCDALADPKVIAYERARIAAARCADAIRAMPLPAARTDSPASAPTVTKPLDVSHWPATPGAKWAATVSYPEPAFTMGPGTPTSAPTPAPKAFDAEAALLAMWKRAMTGPQSKPIDADEMRVMLDAGLAAGRKP